jgi:preprotein translocase subunit YajC
LAQLIVIVAMFALLWLLFIRPQRRRAQAQHELVSGIELGDEVLTVGGIYGTVLEFRDENELLVEIAPETRVRVARRAVAAVLPPDDEQEALQEAPKTEPNEEIHS